MAGALNKQNGMTLIEQVVVIVLIGIVASIAWPSWVSVKSEAGAVAAERTKEMLKARWLAARNDHDRGVADEPTLGRLVGYKAAVPPAPPTAPMLIDYSFMFYREWGGYPGVFGMHIAAKDAFSYAGTNNTPFFDSVDQVTCDGSFINSHIKPSAYYTNQTIFISFISSSFTRVSGTESSVAVGAPVPKCRGAMTAYNGWCSGAGCFSLFAPYSPYCWNGDTRCLFQPVTYSKFGMQQPSTGAIYGSVRDVPANNWRLTCKGYEATYGVPYVISGSTGAQNGKTSGSWTQVFFQNYYEVSPLPNRIYNLDGTPPTVGAAVCQRVGPATTGNPEWLGDPKIATDFSGWCLGAGATKKLPTFKDTAKTVPTTAYGDAIKSIGAEVDDPTHCPAS